MNAWSLALIAAVVVAVAIAVLKKPVDHWTTWVRDLVRRRRMRRLAIQRIAVELAQRRYDQDGNPDDELYSDWYRWFTGDPDANVDYSRKQQRDVERLKRGDFNPRRPSGV